MEALLKKARAADEAEKNEPELDIPAEIARRQDRLDAIAAARTRLEQRQRDADFERGLRDDDDQKLRGQDGKPKPGGRCKRPFGVPQDKDQDNFTDPDSRIMQHAGGGFDPAYNVQTAVDDTAHIIVAAELMNNASDVREPPTMLEAVKSTLGAYPEQTLTDAGYRSEEVFEVLAGRTELVVTIGREGKSHRPINEASLPLTAAIVAKMKTQEARGTRRLQPPQMAGRTAQRLDQERLGVPPVTCEARSRSRRWPAWLCEHSFHKYGKMPYHYSGAGHEHRCAIRSQDGC